MWAASVQTKTVFPEAILLLLILIDLVEASQTCLYKKKKKKSVMINIYLLFIDFLIKNEVSL